MLASIVSAAMLAQMPMGIEDDSVSLIERVAAGDESAFSLIVERHQDDVARYCARFVGELALAADLTQETFITLWKERARYSERGKLRTYLLRIARNRCLAATRKRMNRERLAQRWQLPQRTVAGTASEARHIDRALGALKPAQRDLVILRYLQELDLAEIADVTGLRLGTVKSRLSRALAALRSELADD